MKHHQKDFSMKNQTINLSVFLGAHAGLAPNTKVSSVSRSPRVESMSLGMLYSMKHSFPLPIFILTPVRFFAKKFFFCPHISLVVIKGGMILTITC